MAIHCVKLWRINYFKKNKLEAIVLAGGLGTRLKSELNDLPKPMALINGKPFLSILLKNLILSGFDRIILSVGYRSDIIENYFGSRFKGCELIYSYEETPLGTGGAFKKALKLALAQDVFLINGDTLALIDYNSMFKFHLKNNSKVTISLKEMNKIERYGVVTVTNNNIINSFMEKSRYDRGLVSLGSYIINKSTFLSYVFKNKFSLETDFFERFYKKILFLGFVSNSYFIDIGIPEDFYKAQFELGVFDEINSDWTLFLDRDGVINKKIDNNYVKKVSEFKFLPGALSSITFFSKQFNRVIVVTNQQGVGKKLMSEKALSTIHLFLKNEVIKNGGLIDDIFYAPHLESENSELRKPKVGMAILAKKKFPEINFKKSIMIGDSISDLEFAKNLNMKFVLITKNNKVYSNSVYSCESLFNMYHIINNYKSSRT